MKLVVTAKKKNKNNKMAQRSLGPVPVRKKVPDSDGDEPESEYGQVTIVRKPHKKHVRPQFINAMLVVMTRHYLDRLK